MPYGPNGQWRPVGAGACARLVCDIATGESPEVYGPPGTSQEEAARRAAKGGQARAKALTPERRRAIAAEGAAARWGNPATKDQ